MGIRDFIKNKKHERDIKLCIDKYKSGKMSEVFKKIEKYKKNMEDARIILECVARDVEIISYKDLEKVKELREFWKKFDSSSYKEKGLILKNKYKNWLNKNAQKQAEECKKLFDNNEIDKLERGLKIIYDFEPKVCIYILKYVASNVELLTAKSIEKGDNLADFWRKLDMNSYSKYISKVESVRMKKLESVPIEPVLKLCLNIKNNVEKVSYLSDFKVLVFHRSYSDEHAKIMIEDCSYCTLNVSDITCIHGIATLIFGHIFIPFLILEEMSKNESEKYKNLGSKLESFRSFCNSNFGIDFKKSKNMAMEDLVPIIENKCSGIPFDQIIKKLSELFKMFGEFNKLL